MENNFKSTIVLYTYRYIWKDTAGKLCIKILTEPQEGHKLFQERIQKDENIVSCMREYVNEVNFEYLGFTEPVKTEKKECNEDEKESS